MKLPRVFVPLAKEPYNWFAQGSKEWELRRYGRQYTEKNIKKGNLVELRCGYSNPARAIWGVIEEIKVFDSIDNVFRYIDYKKIISSANNIENAIELCNKILNLEGSDDKLIAFKIRIIESPQFIEMSSEFYDLIKYGIKKTTIRKGVRNYKIGKAIIYFMTSSMVANITQIRVLHFNELTIEDAIKDGFKSITELQNVLRKIYLDIDNDDFITIITFEVENIEGNNYANSNYL